MSTKEQKKNPEKKPGNRKLSATAGGVPLKARDAWDARGLIEQQKAVQVELADLEAELRRLIARACESLNVTIDVTPMLFVDNEAGEIVVKMAPKQGDTTNG